VTTDPGFARHPDPAPPTFSSDRGGRWPWRRIVFFAGIFLLLCALRWPLADRPIRDVDESVSALIATSWLEGGVPYRDAIDQRGPVTYLLYAATFLVAGKNDMLAVHWALLLWIFGACLLVFPFASILSGSLRRDADGELLPADTAPEDPAAGYLAAFLVAIGASTYRRSQMLAFHTEWPIVIFSTLGMLLVFTTLRRAPRRTLPRLLLAGACFGASFLAKQPSVFDGFASGIFLFAWQWRERRLLTLETVRRAVALAGGFFLVLGVAVGYFWAAGALADFYLYFWSYNVDHYTAVVPVAERVRALDPFAHSRHYLTANPLFLMVGVVAALRGIVGYVVAGRRVVDARVLLVIWLLAAYFGASYSGRNFGHYFIQILVPVSLLSALMLVEAWRGLGAWPLTSRGLATPARGVFVVAVAVALFLPLDRFHEDFSLFAARRPAKERVAFEGLLDHIARTTRSTDRLFVWGYNPEIYVLSNRRPATRYSNTNYLTGMLPWENHRPGIDTSEHIVPGAWDILMDELAAQPPTLVIDTAVGNHRYYRKYPVSAFPRLESLLATSYRHEIDISDAKGRPYYRVYRRRSG